MDLTIRRATEDDWLAITRQDGRSFGSQYTQEELTDRRIIVEVDRFFVADDGGRIVGVTGDYPFDMTVPGGASLPAGGVTWVSVAATHRRRGILTAMMAAQHRWLADEGYPVAILGASESGIYGRYGYGPTTGLGRLEVDRRFATLRADLPETGPVVLVEPDEARPLVTQLHDRWRRQTPGALSRSAAWWELLLLDRESWRDGASARFFAVHPDGYVSYRIASHWNDGFPAHELRIGDLFTATPGAYIDLWRFLLGVDLVGPISAWAASPGELLPFLLDQPRQARTRALSDGMWLRILDVARTLAARSYAIGGGLVVEVHDPFLGRGGRFLLDGSPEGATCAPTTREPDLALGVAALGAAYLGTHTLGSLHRAGLVDELRPGAVARATAMFAADRPAHYGTNF